jgi:hypothetical protein
MILRVITFDNGCLYAKAETRLTIYPHANIIHVILYVHYSNISQMPITIQNNTH